MLFQVGGKLVVLALPPPDRSRVQNYKRHGTLAPLGMLSPYDGHLQDIRMT